jgi:hypothetical protein
LKDTEDMEDEVVLPAFRPVGRSRGGGMVSHLGSELRCKRFSLTEKMILRSMDKLRSKIEV